MPRPGQMGTSIYVELGNGDTFIFDFGPGAVANYLGCRRATAKDQRHLPHPSAMVDHFASLPYTYMFGAWGGRWHETLRVTGPSGRTPDHGHALHAASTWARCCTGTRPRSTLLADRQGLEVDVNEFDFRDDGGVVYDQDGVQASSTGSNRTSQDGASAYRLDWNGLSIAFTGDGRPNA